MMDRNLSPKSMPRSNWRESCQAAAGSPEDTSLLKSGEA